MLPPQAERPPGPTPTAPSCVQVHRKLRHAVRAGSQAHDGRAAARTHKGGAVRGEQKACLGLPGTAHTAPRPGPPCPTPRVTLGAPLTLPASVSPATLHTERRGRCPPRQRRAKVRPPHLLHGPNRARAAARTAGEPSLRFRERPGRASGPEQG